ncbi:hypothetical protein [Candidatus Tisiphia endosymbiont of Hybos culiciformis]|uniref:hypothetical protein n=1 Tax=Candidatus Tisiphia endosymbiont of Hybos culiciformis TaxID=3139331 RepID=UPI003CCA7B84
MWSTSLREDRRSTKQSKNSGLPRPLCGLAMTCVQPKTSLREVTSLRRSNCKLSSLATAGI